MQVVAFPFHRWKIWGSKNWRSGQISGSERITTQFSWLYLVVCYANSKMMQKINALSQINTADLQKPASHLYYF